MRSPNKKTRYNPHPTNFAFPESFRHSVTTEDPLVIYVCLAMCWENDRDRLRIQMMLNSRPRSRAITMSNNSNTNAIGKNRHNDCFFKDSRGQKTVANRVREEALKYPNATIEVVTDYYWLEIHYLETNYGLFEWLAFGIHAVLQAGASKFYLPFDGGTRNKQACCMSRCLLGQGTLHPQVSYTLVELAANPLWVASSQPEIAERLDATRGGNNAYNTNAYLHPAHPFVLFTKLPNVATALDTHGDKTNVVVTIYPSIHMRVYTSIIFLFVRYQMYTK